MVKRKRPRTDASTKSLAVDAQSGAKTTVTSSSPTDSETTEEGLHDKNLDNTVRPPFRLLDLPAELRDEIYEKVAQQDPYVVLKGSRLQVASKLCAVSRQVQGEYLAILENSANITTTVVRFDFRPIVRFLNRLSESYVKKLSTLRRTPVKRTINIQLELPSATREEIEMALWHALNPTPEKRGVDMTFSYVFAYSTKYANKDSDFTVTEDWIHGIESFYAGRAEEELDKIIAAFDAWANTAL
ncbi:uncharacterized protein MYCGRDRAFT_89949 [Zymoseptoria tritici IPO323]|uniref:F-box domain-containing protein n=1 Tax=Zymoseptoria tritici (strain CBS 115943 / IPO323) TaxID=336722 RepID=F9WWZ8_ZYMTI|nr:uncharacterized protein MYCGRDRAFT_89949 [Zymoseptoria tritici IPO323]EGP92032.1 hypothetical protein MYCGRDRAFT_89949 [Zymoseptoria tritici IPO323]